jgi:hypothetical protein
MTPQVHFVLQTRWEVAGKPNEGWVWPALTAAGHIDQSSLKKQHARAFRLANTSIAKRNENGAQEKLLAPWVLTPSGTRFSHVWVNLAAMHGH